MSLSTAWLETSDSAAIIGWTAARTFACRASSINRLRADLSNQPSGLSGTPDVGHTSSARRNASESASSAAATSRFRDTNKATSRPRE